MTTEIPRSIAKRTNTAVYNKLISLDDGQRQAFLQEYYRKRKNMAMAYVLWVLFGLHFAYLNRWGLQVMYWITLGGFGFWALWELVSIPDRIVDYNTDLSTHIMKDIVAIGL